LRTIDLGYDQSYVFTVPLTSQGAKHKEAIKTQLKNTKEIIDVSASDIYDIANLSSASGDIEWNGKATNSNLIFGQANIDKDFIPTLKINLLEGHNFTGTPIDSASFIVNEAAVLAMGLQAPYTGQPITFHGKKGHIIGVVKDFNFKSLKEKTTPLVLYNWWNGNILHIRSTANGVTAAIDATRQEYAKYADDLPFSFAFVDNQIENQYLNDQRIRFLFNFFAGIAIFISCLGLFGLATYNTQIRMKEIGIRKVLGANMSSVIQLLSKETVMLLLIAILIASPVAWWTMHKWLQGFAYRIEMQWWMFAAAGSLAMLIALLTVSMQAIRAARMNPMQHLRND
jgi:putative ABC transport system permease protein